MRRDADRTTERAWRIIARVARTRPRATARRSPRRARLALALSVVASLAALASPRAVRAQAEPQPLGGEVYVSHCRGCHGNRAQGRYGTDLAAVLNSVDPQRYARSTTERGVAGTTMPPWARRFGGPLSAAEADAVAAHVVDLVRARTQVEAPAAVSGSHRGRPILPIALAGALMSVAGLVLARR